MELYQIPPIKNITEGVKDFALGFLISARAVEKVQHGYECVTDLENAKENVH